MKLSLEEIKDILPHRNHMLMIDEVMNLDIENKTIKACKKIFRNSIYVDGHYPNYPIVPGVMIIEGIAQASGIIIMKENSCKIPLLVSVEKIKFIKKVIPDVNIIFDVKIINSKKNFYKAYGRALVNSDIVAECTFVVSLEDDIS